MGNNHGRRFEPAPRVLALIERYGAVRVGLMYGLDGDALRRYAAGVSQRATRWWIEVNAGTVERDLLVERRAALAIVRPPSTPPGEGA
jgi:hypothetical protein